MKIKARIELLLTHMNNNKIDAIIVPSNDHHFSEYVADYYKCREFISGFNGSAGTMVITLFGSALWTDSRYFLQAEQQLKGSGIELMRMGIDTTPTPSQWLSKTLSEGGKVAIDSKLFSIAETEKLQSELYDFDITPIDDPFLNIWNDRPKLPNQKIIVLDAAITGENTTAKISRLRNELELKENEVYLVSALDEVAWLMNIRGADVDYNPVAIAYAAVELDKQILFIDKTKVEPNIENKLKAQNIEIREYNDFDNYIAGLKNKILILNSDRINYHIYLLASQNSLIVKREIGAPKVAQMKALKNKCEIEGFKRAMIEDGVALVKFNIWLEEKLQSDGYSSEMEVSQMLREFRSQSPLYKGLSFGSIVGYKQNGALAHYNVTKESSQTITADGFLLMDSGGQYACGTTDITRTIHLSKPTKQQQIDFTLVLEG
ncbi:MAG: aminopeptidase P family N-terminal domain-containing protein, partial [Rikenellaceae bacterium]